MLIVGDLNDAGVDEPVNVVVGRPLGKIEFVHHIRDGSLGLASEVSVQLGKLWILKEICNREEVTDDIAVRVLSEAMHPASS